MSLFVACILDYGHIKNMIKACILLTVAGDFPMRRDIRLLLI